MSQTEGRPTIEPPSWSPAGAESDASAFQAELEAALEPDPGEGGGAEPALTAPIKREPVRRAPLEMPKRKRRTSASAVLLGLGAFVLVAGLSFAVGRMTVPASTGSGTGTGTNGQQFPGGNSFPDGSFRPDASGDPGGRNGVGLGGGLTVSGTVESVGNGTITVKLADGQTVTVATSGSTTYHGQSTAAQGDVTAGKTVTVQVAPNAPGTSTSTTTRTATDVTVSGN